MAYQGGGRGFAPNNNHELNDVHHDTVSPGPKQISTDKRDPLTLHPQAYGGARHDDEETQASLLHAGPFDDQHRSATPPGRPTTGYSLSESYAHSQDITAPVPPYNGFHDTAYTSQTTLQDPTQAYGLPPRVPSPYERSESDSTEAWKQRQDPTSGPGIRRFQTRKVKLNQASVLSIEYPVPSAIQNSIQTRYRNDVESGSEEFTHMRCTSAAW